MKRFVPALLSIFVSLLALSSEEGILVPREVFVGDTAELSFETGAFGGFLLPGTELAVPPADFAVSQDFTITMIGIRQGESSGTVRIRFVPWISGVLQIPSFTVKKIRVTPPPVRISSLVDKTGKNALERPRSPLLVPGTTYLLYGLIVAFAGALLLLLFVSARIRKYLLETGFRKNAGRRVHLALRQLKLLEKQTAKIPQDVWYARYASILRTYLGSFCAGNPNAFFSATGKEIAAGVLLRLAPNDVAAGESDGPGLSLPLQVRQLLTRIDAARFSGHPRGDSRSSEAETARSLIAGLEAELASIEASASAEEGKADA